MVFDADSIADKTEVTGILVLSLFFIDDKSARALYRFDQCLVSQSIIPLSAL